MIKSNKVIDSFLVGVPCFIMGAMLNQCSRKPETQIVEVEKPIEVVKEVIVEKPVEKIVYKEIIPQEIKENPSVWSSDEMTEEKGNELLKNNDIYCYYVINKSGELRLRKHFKQGESFIAFEALGLMPIIYSSEDLIK